MAEESFAFDGTASDPERNCWLVVHRHIHAVLPSEYDIREIDEALYLERWNKLSEESRKILQDVAIAHEAESVAALKGKRDEDFAALEKAGMKVVSLEGEAKANYLSAAREKTWARMKEQMGKHAMGDGQYDALIAKFYDAARDK